MSIRGRALSLLLFGVLTAVAGASEPPAKARYIPHAGSIPSEYIVVLPGNTPADGVGATVEALANDYGLEVVRKYDTALFGFSCRTAEETARKVARDTRVAYVEENASGTVSSCLTGPVPACSDTTHGWTLYRLTHRDCPLTSSPSQPLPNPLIQRAGKGVIAYVMDTGVLASHNEFQTDDPDFAANPVKAGSRVLRGYDTISNSNTETNPCSSSAEPTAGHGTAVASLLGGKSMGIAPGVTIVPVLTNDCQGHFALDRVLAGLDWVARQPNPHGAVLNISFEDPIALQQTESHYNSLDKALAAVAARGVVPFVAAGNWPVNDPAGQTGVACNGAFAQFGYDNGKRGGHAIVASGTDMNDARKVCPDADPGPCGGHQFGYGQCVDLFAPATCVYAAALNGADANRGNTGVNGTSFAAPLAAGVGARLIADNGLFNASAPSETLYNVWRMIRNTATRGAVQMDTAGAGSPDRLLYIGSLPITQPESIVTPRETSVNATKDLKVIVGKTGTFTYQWHKGPYGQSPQSVIGTDPVFPAPVGTDAPQQETYWVRVTEPSTGAMADSMPATVTLCNLERPHVRAVQSGGAWNLSIFNDTQATNYDRYDWYIGAPGDTSRPPVATCLRTPSETCATTTITPSVKNDYWVRLTNASCVLDSIDSATIAPTHCEPLQITRQPQDQVIGYTTLSGQALPTATLTVEATGSDLQYEWRNRFTGELYGTLDYLVVQYVPPANGPQLFNVIVKSRCTNQLVISRTVSVLFPLPLSGIDIRKSNGTPSDIVTIGSNSIIPTTTPTIYVPNGRAVAITGRPWYFSTSASLPPTKASISWTGAPLLSAPPTSAFFQNVTASRSVIATATQSNSSTSVTGTVQLQPCGVPLIPDKTPGHPDYPEYDPEHPDHPHFSLRADAEDVVVEWYSSDHDDTFDPVERQDILAGQTKVTSTTAFSRTLYWARVIAKCGSEKVVEDTPTFRMPCIGRCAGTGRSLIPNVKGLPTTFYKLLPGEQTVPLSVPDQLGGDTYEWRHSPSRVLTEAPFSTLAQVDVGPGTYWVRTTNGPLISDSEVVTIAPPDSPLIELVVEPQNHVVGAQQVVRATLKKPVSDYLPGNACNVHYDWWEGKDDTDPAKFHPYETDSDPLQLFVFDLPDNATFWFELTWDEGTSSDCSSTGAHHKLVSELVKISVICDPPATVDAWTVPPDPHVGKNEPVRMSANGLGKLLTYTWYKGGAGDTTTPTDTGRDAYKAFEHDQAMWVEAVDACGNSASAQVKFYVCRPTIVTQPAATTIVAADKPPKHLQVVATPAQSYQTLSFQWYHTVGRGDIVAIPGATMDTLEVTAPASTYWCYVRGNCTDQKQATAISAPAQVDVCAPPVITSMTTSHDVRANDWETLQVNATGTALTYQWYAGHRGDPAHPIAGATSSTYVLQVQTTATYWVQITSQGECSIDSQEFTLTACAAPQINSGPTANPTVVPSGSTATLSVTATPTSTAPLHYTWFEVTNLGNVLVGSDQSTYVTDPLTVAKTYFVRVASGTLVSVDSANVTVGICTFAQSIPGAPDAVVSANDAYVLTLPLDPTDGNTVTWYRGASGDTSTQAQTGASNQLLIHEATSAQYWAKVVRGVCSSNSSTTHVYVCVPKALTQPAPGSITAGDSYTMTFSAGGTDAALTYQWYRGIPPDNRDPVAGQTSASLTVSPATTTTYFCRATSNCGRFIDSNATTVNVCNRPVITAVSGSSIAPGQLGVVHVDATGNVLTYQWYRGASGNTTQLISGATSANYSESPAATSSYWCRVTSNGSCWADSASATISVCTPATITTQPVDVQITTGQSAQLSVTANGASGYQWLLGDGTPISGATSTTYTTPALTADATYRVRVFNGLCTTDSRVATITVCNLSAYASPATQILSAQVATLTASYSNARGTQIQYSWYAGASGDTSHPLNASTQSVAVTPASTTQYWVRVNDGTCTANSAAVTVQVCLPIITTQPANVTRASNQSSVAMSVTASPATGYQWYIGQKGDTTTPVQSGTTATINVSPTVNTRYWVRVAGNCGVNERGEPLGTTDSESALVTFCQVPAITQATPSQWIARGSSITLGVVATGTNLTYQWYTGASGTTSSPISGATAANYAVSPQNTTSYWVRVSGMCTPAVDSNTITISVCATPSITTQPQSVSIFSGNTATLSVTATEATTAPVTYQWYRGNSTDTTNPVGTASTYTTPALTTATSYWVRISCGACTPADSQTATVSICALPPVVSSSGDVQTTLGQSTVLSVNASGSSYTWYTGAATDTSHPYVSGNYPSITVAPTVTAQYWAQVTNGACVSRTNTITVSPCVPQFTTQPQSITIAQGTSTTLTAAADTAGVTYQWYVGATGVTSSPFGGATGTSLTVTPGATTNYWVRATSTCGRTVDSNTATVTMCAVPVITQQPGDVPASYAPATLTKSITATGSGTLTYQWYQGETGDTHAPITSATSSSYSYNLGTSLKVWVRVTGQCGTADSNATWFSVIPRILGQPQSQTVSSGSSVTLTVGAQANGSVMHFKWKYATNGVVVPGSADAPTLTTGPITSSTSILVEVTSGAAMVTSQQADITVCSGPQVTLSTSGSSGCRYITANITGNYTDIEWYRGQPGDTSWLVQTGNTYYVACPSAPSTTYWVRVYGTDYYSGAECDASSAGITLSP